MNPREGDDTGIQTRVWGPAGWLFLHSIAQNYPWKPDQEKKENYLTFFKQVGNVLPCRYCRESYQKFITEPGTELNMSVMESRKTFVKWLYLVHNKVNKKLGVKKVPSIQKVWNRYESYRSKCTKSPEIPDKPKKGCHDPLNGYRKKCIVNVIKVDSEGNPLSFGGGNRKKVRLISIKKSKRSDKKYTAIFEVNGSRKSTNFGAKGMSDFTIHKDLNRRNRYITRHLKDLRTNDPTRAGYLSMFILWNKKSFKSSLADYRRRLNKYNSSGKFPKKIN